MQTKTKIEIHSWLETHDQPFILIDEAFRIVAVNRAYEQVYQIPAEALVGQTCYNAAHHNEMPCFNEGEDCPYQQIYQGHEPHTCLHTHFDGEGRPRLIRIKVHRLRAADGTVYLGEAHQEIAAQDHDLAEAGGQPRMVGRCPAFLKAVEKLEMAAKTDVPVLLLGETGTGKELAASFIHRHSQRQAKPFVFLDCTALVETLFESEAFGHEHGAFTGTTRSKKGLFELADGGTLFLDEIGEMPLAMQAKLLRVLESREFRRVGSEKSIRIDLRVVCATNRPLWECVKAGTFREDLFFRIACFCIRIPPLRERLSDLSVLSRELLQHVPVPAGRPPCEISDRAIKLMRSYPFPGNIRELRNILQVAAASSEDGRIGVEAIEEILAARTGEAPPPPPPLLEMAAAARVSVPHGRGAAPSPPAPDSPGGVKAVPHTLKDLEERYIADLLREHGGHRRKVATIMGISERTLYRKLKQYGLR
ncbi:MAG TPA: sigma 54-interacting transcriptional regulator [bacterium]|jgi:transcriptional regulator with PAS, ATPase and Fis domain